MSNLTHKRIRTTESPWVRRTWLGIALVFLFLFLVLGVAMKARRRPIVTGDDELIGSIGVTLEDVDTEGWARVHSEQWRVVSPVPLKRGQSVRLMARSGLTLSVRPDTEVPFDESEDIPPHAATSSAAPRSIARRAFSGIMAVFSRPLVAGKRVW